VRRRLCVGGGAPPFPKNWRRRRGGQTIDLFCNKISTQQKWHRRRADKLLGGSGSGGGALINKSRRRRSPAGARLNY